MTELDGESGLCHRSSDQPRRAFRVAGSKTWIDLTEDVTSSQSEYTFRLQLKTWIFKKYFPGAVLSGGVWEAAAPKLSVKWLHRALSVLVTSLCLAFSGADIEFDLF